MTAVEGPVERPAREGRTATSPQVSALVRPLGLVADDSTTTIRCGDHAFAAAPSAANNPAANRALLPNPREHPEVCELIKYLAAEVEQLKTARDTNRRIGMAMGIVMSERQVDDEQAFAELRRISQDTNRKLRDVAEDVIRNRQTQSDGRGAGCLPNPTRPRPRPSPSSTRSHRIPAAGATSTPPPLPAAGHEPELYDQHDRERRPLD